MPFDSQLFATRHGPMWALRGDAYITRSLEVYGEYCQAEADIFRQIVRPGMTVVEAGANIGTHTVMLARACAPGALFAFEPQQRVFQLLCANLTGNQIANVVALPHGLGAADGEALIPRLDYGAEHNFGSVSLRAAMADDERWRTATPTRVDALDSLGLPGCDFLKIDVEGWELEVLQGARETIRCFRPAIYVENDRASKQAPLIAAIEALNYAQYWHVAPLYSETNFNGVAGDIFRGSCSLNMLCAPRERNLVVKDLELIDPNNWRSPTGPIPD